MVYVFPCHRDKLGDISLYCSPFSLCVPVSSALLQGLRDRQLLDYETSTDRLRVHGGKSAPITGLCAAEDHPLTRDVNIFNVWGVVPVAASDNDMSYV